MLCMPDLVGQRIVDNESDLLILENIACIIVVDEIDKVFAWKSGQATVSFTDLDQEREILSRFSLPKSMKHSVENWNFLKNKNRNQFEGRHFVN